MTDREAVQAALVDAHRREWAFVLAATVRVVRDLDLAEECVQEAYAAALQQWAENGIPANPAAWLTTAARRRGIDIIRRDRTLRAKLPLLVEPENTPENTPEETAMNAVTARDRPPDPVSSPLAIADERLRLVFLCCHPALAPDAQAALTLRLVCGVTTLDIARAFLVPEPTMAARITRAKRKITGSRIPFRLPNQPELPHRLDGVLAVVHLLFTTGHTAPTGDQLVRDDVVAAAVRLGRMLHELLPDEPEIRGLLALMLVNQARRNTRLSDAGQLLRLEEQDRSRWDHAAIADARTIVMGAARDPRAGRYVLQAAIATVYSQAPSFEDTDWEQALGLYDALLAIWPSPIVALNRTIPLAHVNGPAAALREVQAIEADTRLSTYQYLPAVKADLLRQLGHHAEAADTYRRALELTDNHAESDFLTTQLATVT